MSVLLKVRTSTLFVYAFIFILLVYYSIKWAPLAAELGFIWWELLDNSYIVITNNSS